MATDPVTTIGRKIADLEREAHTIHQRNESNRTEGSAADAAARAEYHRRLDRLEDVRRELAQLRLAE